MALLPWNFPSEVGVLSAQCHPQGLKVLRTSLRSGQHDGELVESGEQNQSLAGSQFQAGFLLGLRRAQWNAVWEWLAQRRIALNRCNGPFHFVLVMQRESA